jgi:pSer/pThr/pTyr-binding forkhead associated (FHA) protein
LLLAKDCQDDIARRQDVAIITIKEQNKTIGTVKVEAGILSIGRAADNDIRIDDHTVSGHHAKIVTFFNASYIEDLDSTNGTFVNGQRVTKRTLNPNDVIQVGHHRLMIESDENHDSAAPSVVAKPVDATLHQTG